jgi:hypothetical protein
VNTIMNLRVLRKYSAPCSFWFYIHKIALRNLVVFVNLSDSAVNDAVVVPTSGMCW